MVSAGPYRTAPDAAEDPDKLPRVVFEEGNRRLVHVDADQFVIELRVTRKDLAESVAHACRVIQPPCEAGAPIEASRGTHIDSTEARAILESLRPGPLPTMSDELRDRLVKIGSEPPP